MTDADPTPPVTPVVPPAMPQMAAPPMAAPAAVGPKQTLSLISFIVGLASVVLSGTGILGIGGGIAAIILSRKGKKTEPGAPSWMTTVGLIAGIAGIVLGLIFGLVIIAGIVASLLIPAAVVGGYGN